MYDKIDVIFSALKIPTVGGLEHLHFTRKFLETSLSIRTAWSSRIVVVYLAKKYNMISVTEVGSNS